MTLIEAPMSQQMLALRKANEVRTFKAARKVVLKSMDNPWPLVAEMVRYPEGPEASFTVRELLLAIPWVGKRKVTILVNAASLPGMPPLNQHRMLRDMTGTQRERLARVIEAEHSRRQGVKAA